LVLIWTVLQRKVAILAGHQASDTLRIFYLDLLASYLEYVMTLTSPQNTIPVSHLSPTYSSAG